MANEEIRDCIVGLNLKSFSNLNDCMILKVRKQVSKIIKKTDIYDKISGYIKKKNQKEMPQGFLLCQTYPTAIFTLIWLFLAMYGCNNVTYYCIKVFH